MGRMATFVLKCARCGLKMVGRSPVPIRDKTWICPDCVKARMAENEAEVMKKKSPSVTVPQP
jgi:hypothetical protein